jgi:hypothetical protein
MVRELAILSQVKHNANPFRREPYATAPLSGSADLFSKSGIMKQKKPYKIKSVRLPKHQEHLNSYAASIDIGSKSHFAVVH